MLTYMSGPRSLSLFFAGVAMAAAVGCAKDEAGQSQGAAVDQATPAAQESDVSSSAQCSVALSDFAKNTISKMQSHFCEDAKDGDKHENKPTTSEVQKEKDTIWMNLVFALVDKKWDTHRGHPIGAIIVKDDKLVRYDLNSNFAEMSPIDHAEVRSLRGFFDDFKASGSHSSPNDQLQKATVYGTLEPCQMCAGTINMARVGRVVFGLKDNRFGDAMDYLHAFPYHANFEQNAETRAAKELTDAINKDVNASLAPLMEDHRDAFAHGGEDLKTFRLAHQENATALRNAQAALDSF
ncbi:MAG: nucleoside deaminase [Labilithrix sp.]